VQEASNETIGARIKRLRRERGLTQRELATSGISYAHISRIERGERTPSVKALRKIAAQLGVTASYLESGAAPAGDLLVLRLRDAELALRLSDDAAAVEADLRRLEADAAAAGEAVVAARATGLLGLAALRRGNHAAAVRLLERAAAAHTPAEHPDVFAALARSYVGVGRADDAVALLEDALQAVAGGDPVLAVRYATLLSYALSEAGDLQAAREAVAYALEHAHETEDRYTRVRMHWSNARLAAVAGDVREALASLDRAVTPLSATEDERQLGRAHLLWAETLTFDGRAGEALAHLKLAEQLLGRAPDAEDAYWHRTELARALAQLGRTRKAIRCAEEALALIGDTDPGERGAACLALGEAVAKEGDAERAAAVLRESLLLLEGQRLWREAAVAAALLAEVCDAAGRPEEAAELRRHRAESLEPRYRDASGRRLRLPAC